MGDEMNAEACRKRADELLDRADRATDYPTILMFERLAAEWLDLAQRITARDGKMSLLSLSVFVFGEPTIAGTIPAGSFFPAPDVDSAVLVIRLHPEPLIPAEKLDRFFRLAHAGFGQKRKTLRNSLSSGLSLPAAEVEARLLEARIEPSRRAETLTIAEWARLVDSFGS